jgi:hypothetical protein
MDTTKEICPTCNGQRVIVKRGNHSSLGNERKCYRCGGEGSIDSIRTLCLYVGNKKGESLWRFNALLHKAISANDLKLQADSFYRKERTTKDLPILPHFEVELLFVDSLLQQAKRKRNDKMETIPLHIHYADDKKPFMCWIGDLKTQDEAIEMFEIWCLGSIWSLAQFNAGEEKISFGHLMQELKWDKTAFIKKLRDEDIVITKTVY